METAASRLLESTVDFPNPIFLEVVSALCKLLGNEAISKQPETPIGSASSSPEVRRPSYAHRRITSINTAPVTQNQETLFALAKLGDIASINIDRLMTYDPEVSGWTVLTSELITAASSPSTASSVRLRAAEILVRLVLESASATLQLPDETRSVVHLRLLQTFSRALQPLQSDEREMSVAIHTTDIDVHKIILEGLKSILDQCGETFITGWEIPFEIIGSVFVETDNPDDSSVKTSKKFTTTGPQG